MFRKLIFMWGISLILFLSSAAFAETVYLKNGQVVTGKIIERKSFYIMIQVDGVPYKYYTQQIARIEEDIKGSAAQSSPLREMEVQGISAQKVRLIVELMEITDVISNMEKNLQSILARAPADQKEGLEKLFVVKKIVEKIIPVYDKYYSEDDLKGLIDFYRSPLGIKVLDAAPKILTEAAEASIQYFKENQP